MFCLATTPSFALPELNELFSDENYSIVIVQSFQFKHQPEIWNSLYESVSNTKELLGTRSISKPLREKSISEIAEMFDGVVYANIPEYAYSKIISPKENYEDLTETFRSLGFEVFDNILIEPDLDQSRSAIGLPYTYQSSGSEYELVGWNRVIAIIDSGIDSNHPDFQVPTFSNKVIFWNDTTSEHYSCCVDEYGHGTHIASIAAGRMGDCSGEPYPCNHYSDDYNGDGGIDIRDILACVNAGCNSSGYNNICSGTPKPCNDYDGNSYSCERYGCSWSENSFKGVAPFAKLKIWKVSIGAYFDIVWIADAIWQASTHNDIDVISLSFSIHDDADVNMCTGNSPNNDIQNLYDAIDNAINNNIIVVASAGNTGPLNGTVRFPACMNNVTAVGQTFKKDYECFTDAVWGYICWWRNSPNPIDTSIHYQVKVEDELLMWGGYGGSRSDWSGFQMVFEPNIWPTTIEVKVEGENRYRDCWWLEESITWNPGDDPEPADPNNPNDNDEFWIWTENFNYDSNAPYVVVELFNFPYTNWWSCIIPPDPTPGWRHYYDRDRIYVKIYRTDSITNQGLPVYISGRGPAPQGTIKPDVTAPGYEICAARADSVTPEGCSLSCGNNNYMSCSGVSMATPHVAGEVALLKEAMSLLGTNPSVDDIRLALRKTDNKVILPHNPDNMEGYGKINVKKAVDYITDCGLYQAYDTDGGYKPKVKGICYDYQWSGDSCKKTAHHDDCSGDSVYEYEASGSQCIVNTPKNCKDYGEDWTCSYGRCRLGSGGGGGGCGMGCRKMLW